MSPLGYLVSLVITILLICLFSGVFNSPPSRTALDSDEALKKAQRSARVNKYWADQEKLEDI